MVGRKPLRSLLYNVFHIHTRLLVYITHRFYNTWSWPKSLWNSFCLRKTTTIELYEWLMHTLKLKENTLSKYKCFIGFSPEIKAYIEILCVCICMFVCVCLCVCVCDNILRHQIILYFRILKVRKWEQDHCLWYPAWTAVWYQDFMAM
jgi:hypothetical protein